MDTNIKDNYSNKYYESFKENPTRFACVLSQNDLHEYGVKNTDVWKDFIINIDTISHEKLFEDIGDYQYLAKMYFFTNKNAKTYYIEKLPSNLKVEANDEINKLALTLKEKGILVDTRSAYLFSDSEKSYKFLKYKFTKD